MKSIKSLISIILVAIMLVGVIPFTSACSKKDTIDESLVPKEEVVYYSEYGAVGDGKTDDLEAIQRAHADANERGIAVAADRGKTYYIGLTNDEIHEKAAIIKTNTYWQDAKFIIDDRGNPTKEVRQAHIFSAESDVARRFVTVRDKGYSVKKGATNIGLTFKDKKLIKIVNAGKEDFIRNNPANGHYGKGYSRQEVLLVDADGNIDPTTPLTWDYDDITQLLTLCCTDTPITISGGIFETIANELYSDYYYRNVNISRSNTTLKNVEHYVTYLGSPEKRACYAGFYSVTETTNVVIEDCKAFGHTTSSSYEFHTKYANNVTWKNCTQTNSFDTNGIHGSNYCRNLTMIGCYLNRFDAHLGVYNVTLKDSTFQYINAVGFGKFSVDNVKMLKVKEKEYGECGFVHLRWDYGAFWDGEVVIKNSTVETNAQNLFLIDASWHDWDYGYSCPLPTNVVVENLKVNYTGTKAPAFYVLNKMTDSATKADIAASLCPITYTQSVQVKDCNVPFELTNNQTGLFADTAFEQIGK